MSFSLKIRTEEDRAEERRAHLSAGVSAERTRRLAEGTTVTLEGYGAVALCGLAEQMQSLLALHLSARMQTARGEPTAPTVFRDRDNRLHSLTPSQLEALCVAGSAWVQGVYQASWALKDGAAIPEDYAADRHWPA